MVARLVHKRSFATRSKLGLGMPASQLSGDGEPLWLDQP
jgi:hypothetical protein